MDLDLYLAENFDEILYNPDEYVCSTNRNNYLNNKIDKKVIFDENANTIVEIEKNNKQKYIDNDNELEFEDLDEKEYLEYNQEYFDSSNEYYDIDCLDDNLDDNSNDNLDDNNTNNIQKNIYINDDDNINEDNCEDDVMDELYEKMHQLSQPKNNVTELFPNYNQVNQQANITNSNNTDLIENDDGYYFFNLMNIFVKYYNNKFDKVEHFFSNINNVDNDTTSQMELFFDSILEYKMMVEKMGLDDGEGMKQLYKETEPEKISAMFEKWNSQIYMFELDELKLFSPSLIVCLNYVYEKNILNSDWNIYNLRDN